MRIVVLLVLLTGHECSSITVVGQVGRSVTLPCKYDARYHGQLWMCWGRGQVPNSGCSNRLIATDAKGVINNTRASSRYQLLGRPDQGDVSLTILNVMASDAGQYGCRVEIPGLFNDQKHQINLMVETAPPSSDCKEPGKYQSAFCKIRTATQTASKDTAANHTAGQLTTTETHMTSSFSTVQAKENVRPMATLVCVLLIIVLMVAGLVLSISRRMVKFRKIPQQLQWPNHQAELRSSSSVLQLHSQSSAGIYTKVVYTKETYTEGIYTEGICTEGIYTEGIYTEGIYAGGISADLPDLHEGRWWSAPVHHMNPRH